MGYQTAKAYGVDRNGHSIVGKALTTAQATNHGVKASQPCWRTTFNGDNTFENWRRKKLAKREAHGENNG